MYSKVIIMEDSWNRKDFCAIVLCYPDKIRDLKFLHHITLLTVRPDFYLKNENKVRHKIRQEGSVLQRSHVACNSPNWTLQNHCFVIQTWNRKSIHFPTSYHTSEMMEFSIISQPAELWFLFLIRNCSQPIMERNQPDHMVENSKEY